MYKMFNYLNYNILCNLCLAGPNNCIWRHVSDDFQIFVMEPTVKQICEMFCLFDKIKFDHAVKPFTLSYVIVIIILQYI